MKAKLVRFTIELRYKERMNLLIGHSRIQARLSGDPPQNIKTWLMPGLRNDDPTKRETFIMDADRTLVELHSPRTPDQAIDRAIQIFTAVDQEFTIPEVGRWGVRCIWLFEQHEGYEDLIEKWRERFFASTSIVVEATDVGILLDFTDDETGMLVSLSGGPTNENQIKERWVTLGNEPQPATANVVDVDMAFTDEPTFSRRTLANYAKQAIRSTEAYSLKVNSVMEGRN